MTDAAMIKRPPNPVQRELMRSARRPCIRADGSTDPSHLVAPAHRMPDEDPEALDYAPRFSLYIDPDADTRARMWFSVNS